MDHFGHFILEAMARLWFIRAYPELPVLWHDIALPIPHTPWPGWRELAWRLLALDRHVHHVIHEPGRFDQVIVPRPGLTVTVCTRARPRPWRSFPRNPHRGSVCGCRAPHCPHISGG
jgi:hypothetical protein